MPHFNLATKSSMFLLLICLSTSLTVGWISYIKSKAALEAQTFDRLTAIQTAQTAEIERYFRQIANQIQTVAENPNTVTALKDFSGALTKLDKAPEDENLSALNAALEQFYREDFLPHLLPTHDQATVASNQEQVLSISSLIPRNAAGRHLQSHYIANNPYAVGEKRLLTRGATDNSDYADVHETHHPVFRNFLEKFDYYDLFLVDSRTGNIVYSVFKEIDFGTSLARGPHRHTNLARAI